MKDKTKKILIAACSLVPIPFVLGFIAWGGKHVERVDNNTVTIQQHQQKIEQHETNITSLAVKSEERYDKLVQLMQSQHIAQKEQFAEIKDTMKYIGQNVTTMREDMVEVKTKIEHLEEQ